MPANAQGSYLQSGPPYGLSQVPGRFAKQKALGDQPQKQGIAGRIASSEEKSTQNKTQTAEHLSQRLGQGLKR